KVALCLPTNSDAGWTTRWWWTSAIAADVGRPRRLPRVDVVEAFRVEVRRLAELDDRALAVLDGLGGCGHLARDVVGDVHHAVLVGVEQVAGVHLQTADGDRAA